MLLSSNAHFTLKCDAIFPTVLKCTTVKHVLSSRFKINKTKVLMENGSLMEVESIAECSLVAFCNTFDLHLAVIGTEKQFLFIFSGRLRPVLL